MRFHISAAAAAGFLVLGQLPTAAAWPTPPGIDEIDTFPSAEGQGRYSAPEGFYGLYFRTPDGRHCGILPNRGPVGCDAAPEDAPEDSNQTFVEAGHPASYRYSGTRSFTRDVDVLPVGYRLENWGASCGVVDESTVVCKTSGRHGFSLTPATGVLW